MALFALTKFDSFEPGVIWAVGLGGDTDTNAAVTGAVLGCKLGLGSIPDAWLEPNALIGGPVEQREAYVRYLMIRTGAREALVESIEEIRRAA